MNRIIVFIIALAFTLTALWALNKKWGTAPAMGKLLSPAEGFWKNAESLDAPQDETFSFPNLKGNVSVQYDERNVPYIKADHIEDAVFVQGYLLAKNRLWQMDLSVRASGGELAEVLGERALKRDKSQRRKGIYWAAENAVESWKKSPEDFAILQSYCDGVNAYIDQLQSGDYSLMYKLMDFKPRKWEPIHSALFIKSMAETLSSHEKDVENTNSLNFFGEEVFQQIYPEYNPQQSPIIPASKKWDFEPVVVEEALPTTLGHYQHDLMEKPPEFVGSNNWAVAPQKTINGNAILCNDPHLDLTYPSIWYEIGMQTPEFNAHGVCLPSMPGIIIGFNEDIAWGVTNVGHDVMDWYRIEWTDADKSTYLLDGQKTETTYRYETFKVKGQENVVDTVKYTYWGPVVYEAEAHPRKDLAMKWLPHLPTKSEEPTFCINIMASKNYEDFSKALEAYTSPAQNFLFASTKGNIAQKCWGRYPLRRPQQGRFVMDGTSKANDWQGFIPMEHNPQVFNPERGFCASANQRSTELDYPYYYLGGNFDDFRGRYLNRALENMDSITIRNMIDLQNDNHSLDAEEALPNMLALLQNERINTEQQEAIKKLKAWDYSYDMGEIAPTMFKIWFDKFSYFLWDEIKVANDSIGNIRFPERWVTIDMLRPENQNSPYYHYVSSKVPKTAADVVTDAFLKMYEACEKLAIEDRLDWEKYQGTHVPHLANIKAFGSDSLKTGGYANALNSIKPKNGPSWRMVVEMKDKPEALVVYPGGQSENPGSPFYANMTDTWTTGQYYKISLDAPEKVVYTQTFSNTKTEK